MENQRKRVCLVIPSLHAGGMERVIVELGSFFALQEDIDTHLISYTMGESFYELPPTIKFIQPSFLYDKNSRLYSTLRTLLFLRREVKKINPDAVLSFGETFNSFVLLSTIFLRIKVFISDRSKPDKQWGLFHEILRKILYKRAAGFISQTTYSREFITKKFGHKKIKIIPNPVRIYPNPSELFNKVILNVGRLVSTKRIDFLLQVFSQTNHMGWSLWVVGDGPERQNLERLALKLGISEKVKFWGFQKDIEYFYRQAAIFAFTSISEGFPNSLLEAFAAGLPSISFDCLAGPSDLIKDGETGYLIPLLKIDEYKEKLQTLMDNAYLRKYMGNRAFTHSKSYELSKIGTEYLKFLLS